MEELITHLKKIGVLRTTVLEDALRAIDRKDFVLPEYQARAYEDTALPIGEKQTISQPYTVVFMLELLTPGPDQHILEVGFGSGWQTTMLAFIVGKNGSVHAVERVPTLCAIGQENIRRYPVLAKRVTVYCQSAENGLPKVAHDTGRFDRIIVAADVAKVPSAWRKQLRVGGNMVYPSQGVIIRELKSTEDTYVVSRYPGFVFVPFIEEQK